MIYEVKKDDVTFEVDDNLLFDSQSQRFKKVYEELVTYNTQAEFDNCSVLVLGTGRVIITKKTEDDGQV
ncbi:hypothetical protein [Dysgonomonas mossii]|uniref:hypothetical protein n=1 Tax=Dysgonomonas mossii TaxID=163665 RepID=UPI0039920237